MKKIILIGILGSLMSQGALAFARREGTFFCTVESIGGLAYDAALKRWRGAVFRPRGKFVLRLKFIKTRNEGEGTYAYTVDEYETTITNEGSNNPFPCFSEDKMPTGIDSSGFLTCDTLTHGYKFNFKTNRFLESYMVGYIDGSDDDSNTPSIAGGVCTKIQ